MWSEDGIIRKMSATAAIYRKIRRPHLRTDLRFSDYSLRDCRLLFGITVTTTCNWAAIVPHSVFVKWIITKKKEILSELRWPSASNHFHEWVVKELRS